MTVNQLREGYDRDKYWTYRAAHAHGFPPEAYFTGIGWIVIAWRRRQIRHSIRPLHQSVSIASQNPHYGKTTVTRFEIIFYYIMFSTK
jgi:hypothetical protein